MLPTVTVLLTSYNCQNLSYNVYILCALTTMEKDIKPCFPVLCDTITVGVNFSQVYCMSPGAKDGGALGLN